MHRHQYIQYSKKRFFFLSFLCLPLLLFIHCAAKDPSFDLSQKMDKDIGLKMDQKLEERIKENLNKRMELVQRNPVYLSLVSELDKGRELLLSGEPDLAFLTFDKILQDERYTNYPEFSYAKYYLAATLHRLGVDYGALLYFVDIIEKEPLQLHTHESLRWAIGLAQNLKDDELILFLASTITPDKIPLSLREEFRYFIAKDLYKKKDYGKAIKLLEAIPHRNRLFLAAQYLLGTIATENKDLKKAIEYFREISNARSPVQYYEDLRIRQLSNLALGRLFYEEKNYPLAIVYYKKVEKDGDYYSLALYESSWSLFNLHKFNESLSVIHSLHSPFFEQVFFLKSFLLKGAIYLELCLYDDVVRILSSVETEFTALSNQISKFAKQANSPSEYYPLLSSKIKLPNKKQAYQYKDLFNLASANRDFLGIHKYILRLRKEREVLAKINRPRAELISRLLRQRESDLMTKASWLAGRKLLLTQQLIQEFLALKDLLRYEIVSSERKILQTRSMRLAPPIRTDVDLILPKFTESLRENTIWWEYSGEYWKDEVGYYLYNLKSLCKNTGDNRP